jgi:hypothetical protein
MGKDKGGKLEDELNEFSQPHIEAELKKMGKGASGGSEKTDETPKVVDMTPVIKKVPVIKKKVTPEVVDMTPVVKEIKPKGFGR